MTDSSAQVVRQSRPGVSPVNHTQVHRGFDEKPEQEWMAVLDWLLGKGFLSHWAAPGLGLWL